MEAADAESVRGSPFEDPRSEVERYSRLREAFLEVRELSPEEREQRLDRLGATDAGLAQELRQFLASLGSDDDFLARPVALTRRELPSAAPQPRPSIAGFRILRELGHGGMGVVYLAEQASPNRLLALKVLREGVAEDSLARFRREIEALGRLRHPGIAQIHETGVERTDGVERSWFAMEYVEGRSLSETLREGRLATPDALALFLQVCDAVQAAHEAGILHRDIKPENVLVEPGGRARLVDFGVARMTGSDLAAATLHTATGELVGTLAYMSPEQTAGGKEPLDARSDVYSLGVVLYELLTGALPYTADRVLLHEIVRAIREEDPRPLRTLVRGIDSDLETIVSKALEKDPGRRYESAAALAADLRRHLAHQPILARRPSAIYQLERFARRHRGLVAGMAATMVTLAAGLVAALLALGRAWRAEAERARENEAVVRLSDLRGIEVLTQLADELFPASPERAPDLEGWLEEARVIAGRSAKHHADLVTLEAVAPGARTEEQAEELERLLALASALEVFDHPEQGVLGRVERRLELARTLEQRSVGDHAREWDEAIRAIADPAGPYRGLAIRPQLGLVPLGSDPDSGLREFGQYGASGEIPERDGPGLLRMREESGLVFVLLPGGTYRQGTESTVLADSYEGPPREVTVAPFFLSKFEMTQGQWLRVTGSNPSQHEVGTTFAGITTTALHPVEFVSRIEAEETLRRLDLVLPTEAQWEYAVRGGTTTTFWTGQEPTTLAGAANLTPGPEALVPGVPRAAGALLDPWEIHAPVGSLRPNPFGLHDMLGNVKEWCLDPWFGDYHERPLRPEDGLVIGKGDGHFAIRGGCYGEGWAMCRSAHRTDGRDAWRQPFIGVRPARAVR